MDHHEQADNESTETEPGVQRRRRRRNRLIGIGAVASAVVLASTGIGVGVGVQLASSRTTTTTTQTLPTNPDQSLPSQGYSGGSFGGGFPGGSSGTGTDTGSGTTSGTTSTASDAESTGVVLIDTVLGYAGGEAAGTGIVLTSDGEILTNNHVVEGSTSISVTIASTGATYAATVVGTDSTNDIAVLQLQGASGLATATLDTSGDVEVGDSITGVGNAEGQGYLSAADGTITDLQQQITVSDELTGEAKSLDGLIEVDAGIVSGDSGGPLLDSDGEVIGIDTAASSNTAVAQGYAIPIEDALAIVDQIETGTESGSIQIGLPAFLGISYSQTSTVAGAEIATVLDDTPAASAGLEAGDVITAVDGTSVANASALADAIAAHDPGDQVTVTYTDTAGSSHTVTVTLASGPAA